MSLNNYLLFKTLIQATNSKYETLSVYWKYIKQIEDDDTLIEERIINGVTTKVEERIKERLKMFFGLLKRNYEDSTYNKKFYYSDVKLAFMTLWSCLNDIQFIYYDKSVAWIANNNKYKYCIEVRTCLLHKLNLLSPCFLQKKHASSNDFVSYLKADYNLTNLIYQILSSPTKNRDYENSIGEQIAFLILTIGQSNTVVDHTSGLINSNILSDRLACLKDKRNRLYLTHGNENSASTFFTQLEEDNSEVTLTDCSNLFSIIFFLLKGEYIGI